jgi:tetratricopeptide (TPR) repeat protein
MDTAYFSRREYDKAIEIQDVFMDQLDRGITSFPDDSFKSTRQIHQLLQSLGLSNSQLKNGEKALSHYRRALEYNKRCNACIRATLSYLDKQERYIV